MEKQIKIKGITVDVTLTVCGSEEYASLWFASQDIQRTIRLDYKGCSDDGDIFDIYEDQMMDIIPDTVIDAKAQENGRQS